MKNMYGIRQAIPKEMVCVGLLIVWLSVCCTCVIAQQNIVFPADAGVINVTDPLYGAIGDGVTDDTQAIQSALAAGINGHQTVYVPNGTYLVSNTLKWNNGSSDNGGWGAFLSMQGQSREGTIIKLQNNTFTDTENPKAVIMTGSRDDQGAYNDANGEGNQAFEINLSHFTVDVGSGNPGAIAIDYQVSNWGALREVTIKSTDANKAGFCGVNLLRRDNGPGLIEKISIDGFQYGIRAGQEIAQFTLENITITNQSVLGIEDREAVMAIRKLTSVNAVPAIRASSQALLNLIEANLTGGSSSNSAIEFVNNESRGYLRGITTSGYASAVNFRGTPLAGNAVGEWVSDPVLRLSESSALSLNLPIEETPTYFDSNLSNWISVGPPSGGDDADAIQAAMNSGKSTVYFRRADYNYGKTIIVPPSVKHIIGHGAVLRSIGDLGGQVLFRFEGGSSSDLTVLEKFELNNINSEVIDDASARTLVIQDIGLFQGRAYRNSAGAGKLFINNIAMRSWTFNYPQQVWARQFNVEGASPEAMNNGGVLWALGFKVEGTEVIFETRNGGKTEVFGGLTYTFGDSGNPAILNINSQVSASWAGTTYVPNGAYSILVREKSGAETMDLPVSSSYGGRTYSVPMYVGILDNEATLYRINAGGFPASPFQGDAFYSGNTGTYFSSDPIDVSGLVDAAPQAVYQSELNDLTGPGGTFTYTLPDLEAGKNYRVRLHFAERYFTVAGGRVMHVAINGNRVLENFDIFADAGATNKAVIKEFIATAKVDGTIKIDFTSVVDRALVNGIEILESTTIPTGNGTGLSATYFNNIDLTDPALSRTDATINFNWGDGSPGAGVDNETFSARWTGTIEPRYTDTYTFYLTTDNGRRLWINDELIIDKWIDDWDVTYTGTIALQAGQQYSIKVEYFENAGGANAVLEWSSASQAREVVPQSQLYPEATSGTGLQATYFNNKTLSGSSVTSRVEGTVDMDLADVSPIPGTVGNNDFSIRWEGQVQAPVSASYTFTTVSDDGVRLWVDDVLVIDNWSDHSATTNNATVSLNANQKYNIRMEYYEAGGLAVAKLLWSYNGQQQQVIPTENLYPPVAGRNVASARSGAISSEEFSGKQLTAYPNPARDKVTIQYHATTDEHVAIKMYNTQGTLVTSVFEGKLTKGVNAIEWQTNNVAPGFYILRAVSAKQRVATKLMIR